MSPKCDMSIWEIITLIGDASIEMSCLNTYIEHAPCKNLRTYKHTCVVYSDKICRSTKQNLARNMQTKSVRSTKRCSEITTGDLKPLFLIHLWPPFFLTLRIDWSGSAYMTRIKSGLFRWMVPLKCRNNNFWCCTLSVYHIKLTSDAQVIAFCWLPYLKS